MQTPDGLGRFITIVCIDVFYYDKDLGLYKLHEDKQVFRDGRTRTRNYLSHAISEKILPKEDPLSAAHRAVYEELGIVGQLDFDSNPVYYNEKKESHSYPGLTTHTDIYKFMLRLEGSQFNPEGYIERQSDKATYFIWNQEK